MTSLSEWATFYQVLGSASAALTGLQFITIALLADMPIREPGEAEAGDAFATPTIVHFVSALFLAIMGAAPWHHLIPAAVLWGLIGVAGLVYTLIVIRRIRRVRAQRTYQPVLEDWIFHTLLPILAYAALVVAAPFVRSHPRVTLVAAACAGPLLLAIGVHNAWDNVTFLSLRKRKQTPTQPTPPHPAQTTGLRSRNRRQS